MFMLDEWEVRSYAMILSLSVGEGSVAGVGVVEVGGGGQAICANEIAFCNFKRRSSNMRD